MSKVIVIGDEWILCVNVGDRIMGIRVFNKKPIDIIVNNLSIREMKDQHLSDPVTKWLLQCQNAIE